MSGDSVYPAILTNAGRYFDYTALRSSVSRVSIDEIAHALSHVCRFGGHCRRFYSVAEHSVYVSHIVPEEYALQGLMHDAAEAFVGDMQTPLKAMLPAYKAIEHQVEEELFRRFGLPAKLHPCVKEADLRMLKTERQALMPSVEDDRPWAILAGVEIARVALAEIRSRSSCFDPGYVRDVFVDRYHAVKNKAVRINDGLH